MIENLKKIINESLLKLDVVKENIVLEIPKDSKNGDYSTNIAMQLAHELNKSPVVIAKEIVENINSLLIEKLEIKGPGFINFYVKKDYLFDNINTILQEQQNYGKTNIGNHQKINIEFVSANPTGTLHVGHGRGAVYGSSLANILSFVGYDVTREYYINDGGNQISNLNKSIKIRYNNLCGSNEELTSNCYHGKEIIDVAKNIYEKYKDKATDEVINEYGLNYLLDAIKKDLSKLRVYFDVWSSEKKMYEKGLVEKTLNKLVNSGYTYDSENALFLKTTLYGDDKDRVLIKSDKSNTYLLPDIAYHFDKYSRGFDLMIDVLGADHYGYINRLKAGIEMMGKKSSNLTIKILQMVRLLKDKEEIKLSKRTGKTVTLNELLDEVGVDATRYFFANKSLDTQLDFDIGLATKKSNENPIYYIEYAHARICSILREYNDKIEIIENYNTINTECAYNLLAKLYEFPNIVSLSAKKYAPHIITNYVYEVANLFHVFYNFEKVLTNDIGKTKERINLVKATNIVIENALSLISIDALERM
ncbi:MAG: arginine--tRNA ligase [Bacilli bacterium]